MRNIIAQNVPLEFVTKLMLIEMLPPGAGHEPAADFVNPFTVAVIVMVAPEEHPVIAPNVP